MAERNITRYQLQQSDNKTYILTTSLINDKLKLSCQDSNSQTYIGAFTILDLLNISKYFNTTTSVEQIQKYLNGIIEKQRVEIYQDDINIKIILHLINNDSISIPLNKKIVNSNNYYNIQNQYLEQISNASNTTNYSNTHYYTDSQILNTAPQSYLYPQNGNQYYNAQTYNIENNLNEFSNIEIPGINTTMNNNNIISNINQNMNSNNNNIISNINQNQLNADPVITSYGQPESTNNFNFQMNKLENDINTIKPEQEKIANELKKVLDQAQKYKQENELYKNENSSLTKEKSALMKDNEILKNELAKSQNELNSIKEQYDILKNQLIGIQKNANDIQEQNSELLKIKDSYENDSQILKNNIEQLTKENESLKINMEQLNQNISIVQSKNESLIKDINNLKYNLENQQKPEFNEEEIKKLMEELSIYRIKAQENDLLKKQIEDLQYQIQTIQENQEDEETKEVKGDIIHDMSELELLTKKINKENKKIIINLLYKATADSDSAAVFHEKCDPAKSTIVLVETKDGKRFGGFTTCSWSGNCVEKEDNDAFIFSFDKMKTYDNIPGDEAIGCYPKFGPIFLGCQIKIFDNAFTKGGTTFEKELNFNTSEDYELTGGSRTFEVKDIEVYEVIIEDIK